MKLGTFSGGGLGFGLAMYLQDQFTGPSNKIQQSLDKLDNKASRVSQSVSRNLSGLAKGAAIAGIGVAVLASFGPAIQRSIELSDKMADVRKSTGMTEDQVIDLRKTLQGFDTRTNLNSLLDISRIGGQIGVATEQLEGFTRSVDKAVVALGDEFSGGAEQVASELGKISSIFGIAKTVGYEKAILNIGSAINELGAAGLATGPFLSDFTQRLGPIANQANLSVDKVLGLAAAMEELGSAPEEASSGISRLFSVLTTDTAKAANAIGMNVGDFTNMINKDANGAMLMFAERMKQMYPTSTSFNTAMEAIGLSGVGLAKTMGMLAGNTDLVRQKQELANKSYEAGTSLQNEFNIKNQTLAARLEKLKNKWDNIFVTVGTGTEGPFQWLISSLTWIIELIGKFVASPIGGFITSLVMAIGFLAVVVGSAMMASNLFRLSLFKLSFAFNANTAASIRNAVATGRLSIAFKLMARSIITSLRTMAASAWAAIAPLLPVILPIVAILGLVAGAVWAVNKGLAVFNNTTAEGISKLTGFQKILAIIGGVAQAVAEFWSFFDPKSGNSALSGGTYDKLRALGISHETVEAIGSYVVRIRSIWEGFKNTFVEIWSSLMGFWNGTIKPAISALFDYIANGLLSVGIDIRKLGGDMDYWAGIGKVLAYVIMGILVVAIISMTMSLISMAVAVIAATWPLLVIIGVIAAIVWAFNNWGKVTDFVKAKWADLGVWFTGFVERAKNWGANFVYKILEGIKSTWVDLVSWISDAWDAIMQKINPSNWFGSDNPEISTSSRVSYEHAKGASQLAMANTAPYTAMQNYNPNVRVNASSGPVHNAIYLDGDQIYNSVISRQKMEQNRD